MKTVPCCANTHFPIKRFPLKLVSFLSASCFHLLSLHVVMVFVVFCTFKCRVILPLTKYPTFSLPKHLFTYTLGLVERVKSRGSSAKTKVTGARPSQSRNLRGSVGTTKEWAIPESWCRPTKSPQTSGQQSIFENVWRDERLKITLAPHPQPLHIKQFIVTVIIFLRNIYILYI